MRDRPGALADWSDDEIDSPPHQAKEGSKGGLLRFARKGISNANFDEPEQLAEPSKGLGRAKPARSSKSEDPISDSDASEPEQATKRTRHQAKPVNYREQSPAFGEESEKAVESGGDASSEQSSEQGSEQDDYDEEETPRAQARAATRRSRSAVRRAPSSAANGVHGRPRRAAAGGPKQYKEAPVESDEEESASEASDVEMEHEEQPRQQARSKQKRKTAAAGGKARRQQRGSGGKAATQGGGRKGAAGASAEPARRSSRHGERHISYAEDDMEEELFDSSSAASDSSDGEGGSGIEPSFDSEAENQAPAGRRPTRAAATAAAAKGGRGKGAKAVAGKSKAASLKKGNNRKKKTVVQSESEEGSGSEGEGSGSEGSDSGSDSEQASDFSRCKVEKIMCSRRTGDGRDEFHVKFEGCSYRKAVWMEREALELVGKLQLVRNFVRKEAEGGVDPYGDLEQGVHPDWLLADRVIAKRTRVGQVQYLVKWRGLGYAESTWEDAKDLKDDQAHIERFERYSQEPEENDDDYEGSAAKAVMLDAVPQFQNGRQLRDYQRTSLEWMASNCSQKINCILGDEMGLGKTAQSISVLAFQHQFMHVRGPFLVVAPLTTLGHWQREIETWTDMNCVVYAGGKADRGVIEEYDLFFPAKGRRRGEVKPNVVLSSYETMLKEASLFKSIAWETVIVDEAHRMKSTGSSTRQVLTEMHIEWLLLLTGTPVQNNMRELFGILNLLNPEQFDSEADFLETFGDERVGMTPKQVKALQGVLQPLLLRRMKEDVETLPEKEEVIIWVELTAEQRAYYKAIYERQIGTLMAGATSKNMPNLKNLAMELRKVCNHPYLCNGLEEDISMRQAAKGATLGELTLLSQASGKMVLLAKLLPKLRSEGHKVLIFSQFKIMLDVLDDFMKMSGYPCERIDGSTSGRDRQAAIDRYSKEGADSFVFLLSTRAGGQGITLTAADTVIIYDSDWNPQNDLQAMARCHRIGQEKEVTIYRLVSKNTYEENVFAASSRKYGLDEAILGSLGSSEGGDPEQDSKKIADLLKHGAHCLQDMGAAGEQMNAFASEGIDQILSNRTEKRQIGSRAGNSFSVATFTVNQGQSGDDKSFWSALMPQAADAHAAAVAAAKAGPVMLAPRRRKKVNYVEAGGRGVGNRVDSDSDFRCGDAAGSDDDLLLENKGKRRKSEGAKEEGRKWTALELKSLEDKLFALGPGRTQEVQQQAGLEHRSLEECREVEEVLIALVERAVTLVPKEEKQHKARKGEVAAATGAVGAAGTEGDAGKENACGGPPTVPAAPTPAATATTEKSRAGLPDVELIKPEDKLPRLAAKALTAKDLVTRLLKHAHKYQQATQERRALGALLAADTSDQPFQLPRVPAKGCHPPEWWRGESHDRALLRGCHTLGWSATRKSMEAILTDERFGFDKAVQKAPPVPAAPAAPTAPAPKTAAAMPAAAGDEFSVQVDTALLTTGAAEGAAKPSEDAGAAPAAPAPPAVPETVPFGQQPESSGSGVPDVAAPAPTAQMHQKAANGALLLDEKEWAATINKLNGYVKKLLGAVVDPEGAAAAAQLDSHRRRGPKPGIKRGPTALPPHLAPQAMEGNLQRALSRHDSNSVLPGEAGGGSRSSPLGEKRPAGLQPAGEPAAKRPAAQPALDAAAVARALEAAKPAGAAGGSDQSAQDSDPIESITLAEGAGSGGSGKPSGAVHKPSSTPAPAGAPNPLSTLGLQPGHSAAPSGPQQQQPGAAAGPSPPGQRAVLPLGAANQRLGGPKPAIKGAPRPKMKQATLLDMRRKQNNPAGAPAAATGTQQPQLPPQQQEQDVIVLD